MPSKFRQIIRIAGTNVYGTKRLAYVLTEIKGVGITLANVIVEKAGLDQDTRLGFLSDREVEGIESIMKNPLKNNIPSWLLNRQKDRETGIDLHFIDSTIDL